MGRESIVPASSYHKMIISIVCVAIVLQLAAAQEGAYAINDIFNHSSIDVFLYAIMLLGYHTVTFGN